MAWRTDTKGATSPTKSFSEAARSDTVKLFDEAFQGTYFRTMSFFNPDREGLRTRCEAIYMGRELRWQVAEVKEQDENLDSGTPAERRTIIEDGLTFFSAVTKVAAYEANQADLGFLPAETPSLETLGHTHYRSFAEREGIIFDTSGIPHPTLHGEVVTNGDFTTEALKRARAFKRTERNPLANFEDVLTGLMQVNGDQAEDMSSLFDSLFSKIKQRAQLRDIVAILKDMLAVMDCCFEKAILEEKKVENGLIFARKKIDITHKSYYSIKKYETDDEETRSLLLNTMAKYSVRSRCSLSDLTPTLFIEERTPECIAILKDMQIADSERSLMIRAITAFPLALHLLGCREKIRQLDDAADGAAIAAFEVAENQVTKAETVCKSVGMDESGLWRIKAFVLESAPADILPVLGDLVSRLEKSAEDIKEEVSRESKAVVEEHRWIKKNQMAPLG